MTEDTLAQIHAAQLETERRIRQSRREAAGRVIQRHSERKDWPPEDTIEVLGALGLES